MNTRRARFIAFQTLLTAVLMGVIVVTLINPSDETTLFAVDVPGEGAPVAQGPPSYQPANGGRDERPGGEPGRGEGGPANGETGGGTVAPPPAAAPPLASPPAPTEEGPGAPPEETGPPGEQYDDTLARLNEAVN